MNDLLRPALYSAWHDIELVSAQDEHTRVLDIVGPVCESADFLGKERLLPAQPGDWQRCAARAHAAGMSSNYNSRGRAAVLVDHGEMRVVRRRETIEDQLAAELEGLI